MNCSEVQSALSLVVDGQETSLKMQQAIQQSMEEIARQTKPKSRDGICITLL